jgi:hypothetical protein
MRLSDLPGLSKNQLFCARRTHQPTPRNNT